ncbi:phospholipase D family protein [Lacinutrix sp. C3R15]|uniref:phospholipase D family protein n=1 Tax=Flavobacteriaceae TaxID=49546 RepID=UPI001C0856C1|nr:MULTISPECIES: phospholipase D family protein [Flavobacteriaceae]MBU2940819.1 phospholipase D family protein [Lacinutrix sp. C3R15]MDO6624137.1 phospholipase D family protein [Oceanihabitans sp. 1_MG-2023]
MKITFLGQGFESESKKSVGNTIIKLFKENKFSSFTGISAFASEAGVVGLSECIASGAEFYKTLNLIVGIDQEGTSKKALKEINDLGINSYIFYQKESPIFHPKIYLFEGENDTTIIVGSSNLTARGFFGNVESSLMVEFKNDNADGIKLLKEIKDYYSTLFDFTDPNLFKISPEIINQFVSEGIVPTRKVWKKKHKKNTSNKTPEENDLEIPKRPTVKIPSNFKGRYKSNKTVSKLITELEIKNNFEFENIENNQALWESGPLKERDLNIPKGANTNPTGSMLFKKGALKDINTRHYFRDEVFQTLDWAFDTRRNRTHIERAIANIKIVISGIDYGIFPLNISHNTNSEHLEEVKQPASQLHWGDAKFLIAQDELIGKTAVLYKDTSVANAFTLIIE